jgi:hypothetical protein
MAQTLEEIQNEMLAAKEAEPALDGFTSTSTTAIWLLWIYQFSRAVLSIQKRFDLFIVQVRTIIFNLKPGTPRWYVNKAKEFQYGFNLVPEQDYYDNTGVAANVVTASKIIAHASFTEEPSIRMKVAKKVGDNLAKLSPTELQAFIAYVRRYKYAGVDLRDVDTVNNLPATITSTEADNLKLSLRIKYNALVLNSAGARLDGADASPVVTAIKNYLQNLDFNGVFSKQKLVDNIQKVEGVNDLNVDSVQSKYGALPFTSINISFIPDSGYLVIDEINDLNIVYQPS